MPFSFNFPLNPPSPRCYQAVNPESSPPPGRSPRPARRPARTKTSMSHVYRERYGVTNIPPRNTGYKVEQGQHRLYHCLSQPQCDPHTSHHWISLHTYILLQTSHVSSQINFLLSVSVFKINYQINVFLYLVSGYFLSNLSVLDKNIGLIIFCFRAIPQPSTSSKLL